MSLSGAKRTSAGFSKIGIKDEDSNASMFQRPPLIAIGSSIAMQPTLEQYWPDALVCIALSEICLLQALFLPSTVKRLPYAAAILHSLCC
jgi:hypothetical protein